MRRDEARPGLPRWVDCVFAASVLAVGSPVWLLIALAVRCSSRGPVLHRARRAGMHGEVFTLLKFRSMRLATGSAVTVSGDPRVTRIGRVIRATKLDEIPQLVNVLRGEMAIVGPRPEDPCYVDMANDVHRFVLSTRPGMTSPASVQFRHEEALLASACDVEATYRDVVLPAKLEIDAEWLARRTVGTDLQIIAATAAALVRRPSPVE